MTVQWLLLIAAILAALPSSYHAKEKHSKGEGGNDSSKEFLIEGAHEKSGGKQTEDNEHSSKGQSGNELKKTSHAEEKGKTHEQAEEGSTGSDHHKENKGGHSFKFHEGSHNDKGTYEKGYRDKYHKDEKRKINSFWRNHHQMGQYEKYGEAEKKHHSNESGKYKSAKSKSKSKSSSHGKKGKSGKGHSKSSHKGHKKSGGYESTTSSHLLYNKNKKAV